MTRVVVAMSGGVDSSVSALLMKLKGYEVIGVSMKLRDAPEDPSAKSSGCCSVEDMNDARRVCDSLEIPFYAINFKEEFKEKVIDPFVSEYLKGRTPNPCVLCNSEIKFDPLLRKTEELGADYLVTGHYARIDQKDGNYRLLKGNDPKKDQSYFLFSLGQKELPKILFPVGEMNKQQVRELAHQYNLKTKDKPESQEICFVPNDDAGAFVQRFVSSDLSGEFVDESGTVLGTHQGIHHYTIGQRRGTQVAAGKRMYVKGIDPQTKRVILAEDPSLYQSGMRVKKIHWVSYPPSSEELIEAKIRYRHQPAPCKLFSEGAEVKVIFEESQRAITPGQVVVFYKGEELLGGGWIEDAL